MPCGKTVTLWAVCDKCHRCYTLERGDKGTILDAADAARLNGWKVNHRGTRCLCPDCKESIKKSRR